ncbi:hypothetical protein PRUPE_4G141400 [Prunus persica]|uniref:DNA/RNA-binding protein Kin17 WH-like domain-containing protein n=1 Tax=Prunus persica TaxID=3760 RepID=A0A251PKF4_PRUPE|nr:hypothetical protein PRUPE_4G141400 [Prunus persica]
MGKNDFLTPKAIANRIKAKGLQKLRWYCQMCQKQCRDENGFKCHCMSESHHTSNDRHHVHMNSTEWATLTEFVKHLGRTVIDKYVGEIEMLESKHVLRVDQAELETVIPQIGCLVKIVNGAYRGSNAKLLAVDTDKFCAKVQIEKDSFIIADIV